MKSSMFTGERYRDAGFENELDAARIQLETHGKRVLVVGVFIDRNGEGGLARSSSDTFTRSEAKALAEALEHEAARIKRVLDGDKR